MNEYLVMATQAGGLKSELPEYWPSSIQSRWPLVKKYAFAIPDDGALDVIAEYAPRILEVGAGTGYWAKLLTEHGVDVLACDNRQRTDVVHATWHPVIEADGVEMARKHSDRALMFCWPEYDDPMAADCLDAYNGDTVIYIGEGNGGCTGDDTFHAILDDSGEWRLAVEYSIPQWWGIHDSLMIYQRTQVTGQDA